MPGFGPANYNRTTADTARAAREVRKAIERAKVAQAHPRALRGLGGLGAAGTGQAAASGASAGATVGSAVPVIGTAIGAVVGAVLGATVSLMHGKTAKSEVVWDKYKPGAGKTLGRNYAEGDFAEVIKGAFDTNKNIFGSNDREGTMAKIAGAIVQAVKSGQVPTNATAGQVYLSVIRPLLAGSGVNMGKFDAHPTMAPLFVDIADRYLNNLPITRADMPAFSGNSSYSVHAPLLLDALGLKTTAGNPPPSGVPITQPINVPAPTVPGNPLVDSSSVIASLAPTSTSPQDLFNNTMRTLAASGVQPTQDVQAGVAAQVQSFLGGGDRTLLYVAALLLVYMLTSRRGRR